MPLKAFKPIQFLRCHKKQYSLPAAQSLYTIETNHVLILAVMHLRRRPGYWKERLGRTEKGAS
jgi:hypothetical protein